MRKFRVVFFSLVFFACGTTGPPDPPENAAAGNTITGEAQGTTYTITFVGNVPNAKREVDSLLALIDQDLSLWVEGSLINRINDFTRTDTVFVFYDQSRFFFPSVFELSREIWQKTGGAFDPTVYPLVDLWGFGLSARDSVRPEEVDSLLEFVGFEPSKIDMLDLMDGRIYKETQIRKGRAEVKLDFNAIAQGYSIDRIASMLEDRGIANYMVELGGEVRCRGINREAKPWRIAIDLPTQQPDRSHFQAIITPGDRSLATSGSYRKFYEAGGRRYSHIIDPSTGYPVDHTLLSITVLAKTCAEADAYATAFLVMGLEGLNHFLKTNPDLGLEVYAIYDQGGGTLGTLVSPGFESLLVQDQTDL